MDKQKELYKRNQHTIDLLWFALSYGANSYVQQQTARQAICANFVHAVDAALCNACYGGTKEYYFN